MLGRAELLWRDGFAVLVPDLQGHGESTGDRITFGYREGMDAAACIEYLRTRFPNLRVGAVGVSLGGAALTLAAKRARPDAAVLEAVFPTITEALDNRLAIRIGPLSRLLTPLLLLQLKPRLGIAPGDLRPIDEIGNLHCPALVLSGTADRHTTEAQTRALYAAARDPKELWLVPGAGHVDLLRCDPKGYAAHVLGFLEKYLDAQGSGTRTGAKLALEPAPAGRPPRLFAIASNAVSGDSPHVHLARGCGAVRTTTAPVSSS
jgi:pimeloyl-ACP methyl ester carboxylesterase